MNSGPIHFITSPPPAGCWQVGGPQGLRYYIGQRPRWLTRLLCRLLLEWEWIDAEPT